MSYDGRTRLLKGDWTSAIGLCTFIRHEEARALGITISNDTMDPAVLRISGARVLPMVLKEMSAAQLEHIETWLAEASELFDFATLRDETNLYLPKLVKPKLTQRGLECPSGRIALSMDDMGSICGFVQFDLENQRPASGRIQCLVIGESTEIKRSGQIWQRNRQTAARRKVYHILALEEGPSQSSAKVPVYRRLGVAQTIWVRHADFGFTILEKDATLEQIAIV